MTATPCATTSCSSLARRRRSTALTSAWVTTCSRSSLTRWRHATCPRRRSAWRAVGVDRVHRDQSGDGHEEAVSFDKRPKGQGRQNHGDSTHHGHHRCAATSSKRQGRQHCNSEPHATGPWRRTRQPRFAHRGGQQRSVGRDKTPWLKSARIRGDHGLCLSWTCLHPAPGPAKQLRHRRRDVVADRLSSVRPLRQSLRHGGRCRCQRGISLRHGRAPQLTADGRSPASDWSPGPGRGDRATSVLSQPAPQVGRQPAQRPLGAADSSPQRPGHSRLLDDSVRTGVWPDSVQVIGGQLSLRLPTGCSGVAHFRSAARRSP